MVTLLAEHRRVASLRGRGHRCQTCGGHIGAGQPYVDQRVAGDGSVWTYREHESCHSIYWAIHRDAGLCEDDVVSWDAVREVMLALCAWIAAPRNTKEGPR